MRSFPDGEISAAFKRAMPDNGFKIVDYGWTSAGNHLIFYRRGSSPTGGVGVIDFLGYMLEPYASPSRGDEDHTLPRLKYLVTRDEAPAGDYSYHDPNEGAPLDRALPTAIGSIRTTGCMTFTLYETHTCRYDEMEDLLALVKNARDWAEDFAEIER